jgi:SAM-dependent methyltransferase
VVKPRSVVLSLVLLAAHGAPAAEVPAHLVTPPPPTPAAEAALSRLPPDRQLYERFRWWVTHQVKELQADDEAALSAYASVLVARGSPPEDAARTVAVLRQQSRRLEVERWNDILTADKPRFNTAPNAFLTEVVRGRKPGTALDVGMGQGRNALYLAGLGWKVTGFDPADRAVAAARAEASRLHLQLEGVVADDETFAWGTARWDLIVLSYVGVRSNVSRVMRALRPGGIVVVEGFHRDAQKTSSIGGDVVFDTNELIALFRELRVRHYQDLLGPADFGGKQTPIVRYCGEKP